MKKILVVEDELPLQKLFQDELIDCGYDVSVASNGKEALAQLKEKEYTALMPDLVILDIRMPEMDGLETMGHILKNRFDVAVIIHTAYSSYKDDVLALAADDYVVKSHDIEPLKEKIKNLIGV